MGVVMITCPSTGRAVPTGIETDQRSFNDLPDTLSKSKCPHCGAEHVWRAREAWLAADGGSDLPPSAVLGQRVRRQRAAR
jgi:predicted RNA-binding Zn-ribbon protein involved in translation (DUF1610 family)